MEARLTRDRAKELLPVIQAFAEGKAIQVRGSHPNLETPWVDCSDPLWPDGAQYRIKPQPREFWIEKRPSGAIAVFHSPIADSANYEVIHVREVLDEPPAP